MRAAQEEDWAVDYLTRALELDPDNVEAYRMRADAWAVLSEWEEALDDLTECLNRAPSNTDVRLTKVAYHMMLGQHEEADTEASHCVNKYPDQARFRQVRGGIRIERQRYDEAAEDFNAAIRIDPEAPGPYVRRGQLWHTSEDYDRAIEGLRPCPGACSGPACGMVRPAAKACSSSDGTPRPWTTPIPPWPYTARDSGALYVRGRAHLALGRYKRAMTDLNRYLLKYPDDVEARCYRGLAKEKAGNRKGARKDYARAYRIAEEIGNEKGAALVIRLFPDLKQRKARR